MYHPPRNSTGRNSSLSAANSSRTNPTRSNNDRDKDEQSRLNNLETNSPSGSEMSGSQSEDQSGRDLHLLNQIVQQFFAKGALIVVTSRVAFPLFYAKGGGLKQNKWFSIVQNDAEELFDRTTRWRTIRLEEDVPPPMTIEIYLDLADLTKSQSLVILDDEGKRWNVADFLSQLPASSRQSSRSQHLVLERWEFSLDNPRIVKHPINDSLPNVYKRCIPVVRSMLSTAMLLPAWKYFKKQSKAKAQAGNSALKLKYRIVTGKSSNSGAKDSLSCPLYPGQRDVTGKYTFGGLSTPAGQLQASVTYRTNWEFRVDDSEALLSSHFMGMDDYYFKPSLGRHGESQVVGSAPATKKGITERLEDEEGEEAPERSQTYGSLSTFHGGGKNLSSSPMTALRNISQAGDEDSLSTTPAQGRPSQLNHRSTQSTGTARLPVERRVSISFQPFKAGSLSSSPGTKPLLSPGPSTRGPIQSVTHRPRTSINTLPQAILRTPNIPGDTAVASSTSSSPKPAPINRYSSSFSHRRSRLSSGASRGDDDPTVAIAGITSSRDSPTDSTTQQGGVNPEGSGSVAKTDDESLQDFLKFIEQKKDLSLSGRESPSQAGLKATAALQKYRGLKDTARELSDSLSSSLAMRGSSMGTSSSSKLGSNVPLITGATARHGTELGFGTSVSPGAGAKPLSSPHAVHAPIVPSRLSANSVVDYEMEDDNGRLQGTEPKRSRSSSKLRPMARDYRAKERRTESEEARADDEDEDEDDEEEESSKARTAIPIPTSPRPWSYGRRASSVKLAEDEGEPASFGLSAAHVSRSLPAEEHSSPSVEEQTSTGLLNEPPSAEDSAVQSTTTRDSPPSEDASEEQLPTFTRRDTGNSGSSFNQRRGSNFSRMTARPGRTSSGRGSVNSPKRENTLSSSGTGSTARAPTVSRQSTMQMSNTATSSAMEDDSPGASSSLQPSSSSASGSVPAPSGTAASSSLDRRRPYQHHHQRGSSRGGIPTRGSLSDRQSLLQQDDTYEGEMMFHMSELGASQRKSLEEGRGGASSSGASGSGRLPFADGKRGGGSRRGTPASDRERGGQS